MKRASKLILTSRPTVCRAVPAVTQQPARLLGSNSAPVYDEDKKKYYFSKDKVPYKLGKHRSNALELIDQQDVILVEGERVICDGGGGAMGHPIEYISLARPGVVDAVFIVD
eukprot:CAMPEP_0194142348 /NCGR_PEP_ID=MMETSP0152-20130528/11624_1 /TAXON_ID=1049557 /ORGANISM="Thalassiothrix antarctica, Strain L6-D1" /LENGTH=111 /DNA_ID=CAMNT_0038841267 /DNA_START=57 /DNA_END=393 /DNA_ORIENTATION=-